MAAVPVPPPALSIPPRPAYVRALWVLAHVAAWSVLAALPLLLAPTPPPVQWLLLPTALLAGFFYLNYGVLIPHLLARRRFGSYFAVVALCLLVLLTLLGVLPGLGLVPRPTPPPPPLRQLVPRLTVVFVQLWLVSTVLRIAREWLRHQQQREQLAADQLAAELAFLRSQVSPHFLFNTLNNVYSLAELKSDDAPAAILKLANLMRYMLYEASAPRVALAREVQYLYDYVDLQRLRLDPGQVPIELDVTGDLSRHQIEPMLLIPFVENAFKHGVSYQHPARISVQLAVEAGAVLRFRVHNLRPPQPAATEPGGVGLANVAKRLHLLYADRYELLIDDAPAAFGVSLTLHLQPLPA